MVSKRWQRTQNHIAHLALILFAGIPYGLFELDLPGRTLVACIVGGYLVAIPLIRYLYRRYANTFVKVFICEYETAAIVVQRALRANKLPFNKQTADNQITFNIRAGQLTLEVTPFLLNMMVDSHLTDIMAAKLTLQPETKENAQQMKQVRIALDKAFATI